MVLGASIVALGPEGGREEGERKQINFAII